MLEVVDVSQLTINPELGQDLEVAVLVKWTNQTYHDENFRSLYTGEWDERADVSKNNAGRHRQQYYQGLIGAFNLSVDFLDPANAQESQVEVQPTDLDISEDSVVIAAGNRILVRDTLLGPNVQTIRNPWFARLHTVEKLSSGNFLTVSSAFDQVLTVDQEGNIINALDIWSQGRNINTFGHTLVRSVGSLAVNVRFNPAVDDLKESNTDPTRINVIDDPAAYRGLGLPTYLTPSFVNGVSYDPDREKILATALNASEAWHIDPTTGEIEVIIDDLIKPHGLRKYKDGYIVTDSGREVVRILDSNLKDRQHWVLSNFSSRKVGLERFKWLQNTTQIAEDVLVTISSARQKVTLIDTAQRTYREIPFDENWGIQVIKPYSNKPKALPFVN